jgi:hypothetical protein
MAKVTRMRRSQASQRRLMAAAARSSGNTVEITSRIEQLDNPADPSVRLVEPRCQKCGQTFSTEAELLEHARTCKGGRQSSVHAL